MSRWLYTVLLYLLSPFLFWRLWRRGQQAPAYRLRWRERWGLGVPRCHGAIWVHAVSVGEVIAAVPLVRALQIKYPDSPMVVTTMTPTGSERVRELFADQVVHVYAPYDFPGAVSRFLAATAPRILVIIETELWPNLIHGCHRRAIPVILANARLSERSARGYSRIRWIAGPMLRELDWVAAQARPDADRFAALGVANERISVTGSLKFDMELPAETEQHARSLRAGLAPRRPVWIAASTHQGEDEQLLEAHRRILADHPDALLILVPRHPERFVPVGELVEERGFRMLRRSGRTEDPRCQVLLGDTMGELLLLYGVADVAFVGGSLVPHGGHNPLEPALWGMPVLVGPHVFNFQEVCSVMERAGGLLQLDSATTLAQSVSELFADRQKRTETGRRARATVEANRGTLGRLLSGLDRWLGETRKGAPH